jgi:hypothetical protein
MVVVVFWRLGSGGVGGGASPEVWWSELQRRERVREISRNKEREGKKRVIIDSPEAWTTARGGGGNKNRGVVKVGESL